MSWFDVILCIVGFLVVVFTVEYDERRRSKKKEKEDYIEKACIQYKATLVKRGDARWIE